MNDENQSLVARSFIEFYLPRGWTRPIKPRDIIYDENAVLGFRALAAAIGSSTSLARTWWSRLRGDFQQSTQVFRHSALVAHCGLVRSDRVTAIAKAMVSYQEGW